MGRPYSQDLRERVLAVVDGGIGVTATGRLLRVSTSYVSKVMSRREMTGETTARALGRGPRPKLAGHHETLRQRVVAVPDETLAEMCVWLLDEHGVSISIGPLCTMLRRLKLTRKKRHSTPPSRSAPTLPPRARPGARSSRA